MSVVDTLGLPVKFIGVGETAEDLQPFDPEVRARPYVCTQQWHVGSLFRTTVQPTCSLSTQRRVTVLKEAVQRVSFCHMSRSCGIVPAYESGGK